MEFELLVQQPLGWQGRVVLLMSLVGAGGAAGRLSEVAGAAGEGPVWVSCFERVPPGEYVVVFEPSRTGRPSLRLGGLAQLQRGATPRVTARQTEGPGGKSASRLPRRSALEEATTHTWNGVPNLSPTCPTKTPSARHPLRSVGWGNDCTK